MQKIIDLIEKAAKTGTEKALAKSGLSAGLRRTVTESIWDGYRSVVPLADVQHIEKVYRTCDMASGAKKGDLSGLIVVTKFTRWDMEADTWANNIYLDHEEAASFLAAWCVYRHELEQDTLMDIAP